MTVQLNWPPFERVMSSAMNPEMLSAWRGLLSSWDAWLLTFVLAVVVPALGYVRYRRLLTRGDPVLPVRTKLAFYARIIGSEWILVAAMLWVVRRHRLSLDDAGERLGDAQLTLGVTLALLVILAIVSSIVLRRIWRAPLAALRASGGRLRRFAPVFGLELAVFGVVCLTAS